VFTRSLTALRRVTAVLSFAFRVSRVLVASLSCHSVFAIGYRFGTTRSSKNSYYSALITEGVPPFDYLENLNIVDGAVRLKHVFTLLDEKPRSTHSFICSIVDDEKASASEELFSDSTSNGSTSCFLNELVNMPAECVFVAVLNFVVGIFAAAACSAFGPITIAGTNRARRCYR